MRLGNRVLLLAVFLLEAVHAQQQLSDRERTLLDRIAALEERLSALEKRASTGSAATVAVAAPAPTMTTPTPAPAAATAAAVVAAPAAAAAPAVAPTTAVASSEQPLNGWLKDTTVNFYLDTYFDWNTNRPPGGLESLRVYNASANNFSVNQTGLMVERAPDVAAGRRWGYRLDLMYGQASELLHSTELRPNIYRDIFQAYGTYVAPVGKGLTVDVGKWASTIGAEGTYAKDQINYSRSFFFTFLPFYHNGVRASYAVNDKVSLAYWLVNGANQAEDFNGFKSQLGQVTVKPHKTLTWTVQYYNGREQMQAGPGLGAPRGRFHIVDTFAFWTPTPKLTLGTELVYVVNRVAPSSPPQRNSGGIGYLRYQVTPKVYFGQRYAHMDDHAGAFSGTAQKLNDLTSTVGFRLMDGFETRVEYRRDFSNVAYFSRRGADPLSKSQNTFTLGLLWWFGGKAGTW